MTTLVKYVTAAVLSVLTLMSCNTEPSLQEYLVAKQDDNAFMKVDVPTSLLDSEANDLTEEQKNILKTVKKINVVAYPLNEDNRATYETESQAIKDILADEKYQLLTKMKMEGINMTLTYTGDEDAIDEVVVLANSDEKGFAVFRLLGNNMRPEQIMQLMNTMNSKDMDMSQLGSIAKMFDM